MFAPFRPRAHPRFLASAATFLVILAASLYSGVLSAGHPGEATFPVATARSTGDYLPEAEQTPGPTAAPTAPPGATFDYDGEPDSQWLEFDVTVIVLLLAIWFISILAAAYIAHESDASCPSGSYGRC